MLRIEEYISRRKKEDRIDEFDIEQRNENMKLCVNYVFEYFNNYLNITEAEEMTILKEEKLDKFRNEIRDYDVEVREWAVRLFNEYGKKINRQIGNILKDEVFLYIYTSDSEFRNLSYECYSKLIKKLPFLKNQTEMLFLFIKEYQRIESEKTIENIAISDNIDQWVEETWRKYNVNLIKFTYQWADYFYENCDIWPVTHRSKSQYNFRKYDYNYKQTSNLFNIDSFYRKTPKKPFIKGRKQEIEVLLMYHWVTSLEGDEGGYWDEYLEKSTQNK